jgi:hypothetical protein
MCEELAVLAERKPQVGKAMVTLRKLTGDELARDLCERREKARRDQQSREDWARQQGAMMEREKWQAECENWQVECENWQAECESWQAEREKWQSVLADKDAEIARLREHLENRL